MSFLASKLKGDGDFFYRTFDDRAKVSVGRRARDMLQTFDFYIYEKENIIKTFLEFGSESVGF
jgi:hypothetical protein